MTGAEILAASALPSQASDRHQDCCLCGDRQLEVLRNEEDGTERGSLLWLLDHTRTPAGGRLMRSWVAHPLTDGDAIRGRLDAVEELSRAEAEGAGVIMLQVGSMSPVAKMRRSEAWLCKTQGPF